MKFPCVLENALLIIIDRSSLSFAIKTIGPPWCTLLYLLLVTYYELSCYQNYLLPLLSVLAENTLLKTACHFLLLLVGFDTLTYRNDYDWSPILVGYHSPSECASSCVFREQTIEQAQELLNNILKNYDDWTLPEPPPKPTLKKRGHLLLTRQQGVSPMGAPWCLVGPQAAVWPNSNAINSLSLRKK